QFSSRRPTACLGLSDSNCGVKKKGTSLESRRVFAEISENAASEILQGDDYAPLSCRFESSMPSHTVGLTVLARPLNDERRDCHDRWPRCPPQRNLRTRAEQRPQALRLSADRSRGRRTRASDQSAAYQSTRHNF